MSSGVGNSINLYGETNVVSARKTNITELEIPEPKHYLYIKPNTLNKLRNILDLRIPDYHGGMVVVADKKSTLGSSEEYPLTNGIEGGLWTQNSKNKLKLSKVLKAIWGITASTDIEYYTKEWDSIYKVDTSIVEETYDISRVYNLPHDGGGALGGSCMRHLGERMRIYEDFGCRVAYITDDDAKLVARVLIWDVIDSNGNTKVMYDRIFSSKERYKNTLKKYFKDLDIDTLYGINEPFYTYNNIKKSSYYHEGVPYIDTMYDLRSINGSDRYVLANSCCTIGIYVDTLQNTEGGSDNFVLSHGGYRCDCCEVSTPQDDTYYLAVYDISVCTDCLDTHYRYCEDTDEYRQPADAIYLEDMGYYVSEYYDAIYLEDMNYYVSEDYNAIYLEDMNYYVSEYYDATYLEDMNYYVSEDYNAIYLEDMDYYVSEDYNAIYLEDMDYYVSEECEDYYQHGDGCCYTYPEEEEN